MRVFPFTVITFLLLTALGAQGQFSSTTNNGSITITGYSGPGGTVTIPTNLNGLPVTSIGSEAFYEQYNITSLTIPGTVTNLADYAFYNCANLTGITVASGLSSIGDYAFEGCTSLTNVAIPNTVTNIGSETFGYCSSLIGVSLSSNLASIGPSEFWQCTSLRSVAIPSSVTGIGDYAFAYCSHLTNVAIPTGTASIGNYAFLKCTGLTDIAIPNSVTNIGEYAFYVCTSLASVHFNGNLPVADSTAFANDKATAYYMPGATGWGSTFGGIPTALLTLPYPLILNARPGFGVQNHQFGFTVSWATNVAVVVQASTDLSSWTPVTTNALTNGSFYFTDPQSTIFPGRFYRLSAAAL